jgi:hypothetical protein
MRSPIILLLALFSFSLSCSSQVERSAVRAPQQSVAQPEGETSGLKTEATKMTDAPVAQPRQISYSTTQQKVSLTEVDKAESTAEAFDRKIVRNADITIEVASTTDAQHSVTSIAESHGGFVVTSEAKQRENVDPAQRTLDIKLVVRIPATSFGPTLDEIKKLAANIPEANVTGQDVTEEFIDLEARIKTQKALEVQFLEIMKGARKVEDALEVQRQIADVRTDIEKLEGRKRFLENRSSLSTITVNIQTPKPMMAVSTTGFGRTLRDAVSESLELASGMVVFFLRSVIVLIPLLVLVVLPSGLVFRYFMRRARRMRMAEALATPGSE